MGGEQRQSRLRCQSYFTPFTLKSSPFSRKGIFTTDEYVNEVNFPFALFMTCIRQNYLADCEPVSDAIVQQAD